VTDTQAARLHSEKISVAYSSAQVLTDVDVTVPNGRITAMIGPNGSGKSTLLRALARIIEPKGGTVYLDGKSIATVPNRMIARTLALLPQNPLPPEGLTVRELCRFGRHPHRGMLSRLSARDEEIVEEALSATRLIELSDRDLDQLSGGQRQRAWIAMALAQETPILLLDEPTTYLDIAHQLEILELLRELNTLQGRTIVMVVHDLNHAARYADHIVAMVNGSVYAAGSPTKLIDEKLIKAVFGITAVILPHPSDGTPLCLPIAATK
jgi:ABC-type cobalamin/Fe3+-siderophores transport system ATPase subunit